MKHLINSLFSLFFAIAIGVHIYDVIKPDSKPVWLHIIFYITYGVCWWMLFSKNKNRSGIYAASAAFPFIAHVYYGYRHMTPPDTSFWICLIVCVLLPLGYIRIKKEATA